MPSPILSLVAVVATGFGVLVATVFVGATGVSKSRSGKNECKNSDSELLHSNFSINRIALPMAHFKRVPGRFATSQLQGGQGFPSAFSRSAPYRGSSKCLKQKSNTTT